MVEVYKTDIGNIKQSKFLIKKLKQQLRNYKFNFDLEDCDKVLRAENPHGEINNTLIISLVIEYGYSIEVLPDVFAVPN